MASIRHCINLPLHEYHHSLHLLVQLDLYPPSRVIQPDTAPPAPSLLAIRLFPPAPDRSREWIRPCVPSSKRTVVVVASVCGSEHS